MILSKNEIRRIVTQRKEILTDIPVRSERVLHRLEEMEEFRTASMVVSYVDFGNEVKTVPFLSRWLQTRQMVIPYCKDGEILLFSLKNLKELAPGAFGILEPKIELRKDAGRFVQPDEPSLILVPGIAFDRNGGRIGRGKGYYDRFLAKAPVSVPLVGLAFECQMFPEVPMEFFDKRLNAVVTEDNIYYASKRTEI
ncbi:MAG: 5-formyltetrahydrofolate cyclo-ligase [Planctomycetaceae bacterium]|jgi:5-formyltetrahydrofolate cyclo-ligase|nr:5-formyltetrahydrofolate cyclo-ligase [Planctomycetaceae bacterium]